MDLFVESYRPKRESLGPSDAMNYRAGQVFDSDLMAFRPQRYSLASTRSSVSWNSVDSHSISRRSSNSSLMSRDTWPPVQSNSPHGTTPTGPARSSLPAQQRISRSNKPPAPMFKRLPQEIYSCILEQLKVLHSDPLTGSCATCYLRDLYSLALTSRAWDRAARVQLYDTIHIVGQDSPAHLKKFKLKTGVRLKLLRRTLRGRRVLAQYVRELKVPDIQTELREGRKDTIDVVASIVMACPNLERLVGVYTTYDHNFDRLTHALSTRRNLKEHVWIIGENKEITNRSHKQLPPGLMDPVQTESFLQYHDMWSSLETLFLHSQNMGILEHDVFLGVLRRLPSLQHLHVSNFDVDDFNDTTLQALPALQSLRLQHLQGVTEQGLTRFASAPTSLGLRRLSLINLEIKSLPVIARILAYLTELERFTLIQDAPPELPSDALFMQPVMGSSSISYLHWDILQPGPTNEQLAKSILAGGFPRLRTIRSPSDHDGVLQSICRPRAQAVLASDKYSFASRSALAKDPARRARTLFAARKKAQERLDAARQAVFFRVVVDDEDGAVSAMYDINGFVGRIGSPIAYSLRPDVPGSDDAVVEVAHLVHEAAREGDVKDGCTGLWNASHHAGKKWWWHTERYRWRRIDLGTFF